VERRAGPIISHDTLKMAPIDGSHEFFSWVVVKSSGLLNHPAWMWAFGQVAE